jgi:hypothetical protein
MKFLPFTNSSLLLFVFDWKKKMKNYNWEPPFPKNEEDRENYLKIKFFKENEEEKTLIFTKLSSSQRKEFLKKN